MRARHILVDDEDEAKKAYERVKGGEDFAKVAGELSTDPGSKTEGGDLGFFTKDRMVEPFAEAAFKLEPGQISRAGQDPVRLARHQGRGEARQAACRPSRRRRTQIETYLGRKAQQDVILRCARRPRSSASTTSGKPVEQKKRLNANASSAAAFVRGMPGVSG